MATPVRHVVMFKYKDGVNKDEVHASITAGLASLPAQVRPTFAWPFQSALEHSSAELNSSSHR